MNKQQFLDSLRSALSGLPQDCIDESLSFYSEMIDDRIEEGLSEEDSVADIGSVEDIASQIISEVPLVKIAKEKMKPKHKMQAWEIVLIAVGFPVWFPLLIAAFAVVLSLYVVLWSVIISIWSVFVSLAACSVAAFIVAAVNGVVGGVIYIKSEAIFFGIVMLGTSLVLAGLAIFSFFGCKAATNGMAVLTKKVTLGIKRLFVRKERV